VGEILVHEFITLDGVVETPTWTMDYPFDPRMGETIGGVMGSSRGILMGRNTYEMFAPAWSSRTAEDDPGAPFMNETPKYVVSATLENPDWKNSTVVGPYDPDAIRELKERVDGSLYVSGSVQLVRALLADGLVDQLHLFVYPLALGSGLRLFADGGPTTKFALAASEAFESGVVHLAYRT
jgi:dihydrofolate reductase